MPNPQIERALRSATSLAFGLTAAMCLSACSSIASTSADRSSSPGRTCADLLSQARSLEQSGNTGDGRLDSTLDSLGANCDDEYSSSIEEVTGNSLPSDEQEDPASDAIPSGALSWTDAVDEIGTVQQVCGPLMSIRTSADDVFVNIGRDYPDPSRFTIVLWDVGGVQDVTPGATVCTEGRISSYKGVAQIEQRSVSDVGVVE